ncbi:hypothetical protein GUJ93_ZPchr0007g5349 [Zizania palustris]|uniref:Uncharacterized protein n=1 Tax=Zizania palustris TaxID=103762 RepID=A0A8J5T5T0_ZIZPA|nr:hypothetical protein GUJ93_ZPchr0007g5349 [Zizania palustris]
MARHALVCLGAVRSRAVVLMGPRAAAYPCRTYRTCAPTTRTPPAYYDPCLLYYSNVHFLSSVDNAASTSRINLQNVTSDPGRFNSMVAALVNATADYAARNSTRRYASGEAVLDQESEFPKLYSWAQCTPDLTPAQCGDCLAGIIAKLPRLFTDRIGGRVLGVRCSYRYEINRFLDGPVMVRLTAPPIPRAPPPADAAAAAGGRNYHDLGLVVSILLPAIAALLLINNIVWLCCWRRLVRSQSGATGPDSAEKENIENVESMLIDISVLRAATRCFAAEANKLGEGGFGAVYKGTLPDGDEIAVKRLSKSSAQGVGELKNELALVAKLQHKNLVRLVGVCLEQQERLLVYEFVPNRSLDQILFDAEKREQLDWGKSYPRRQLADMFCSAVFQWVWEQWTRGQCRRGRPGHERRLPWSDVMRCIHIGLLCVQGEPADRPVMSSVVMMLGSDTISLRAPLRNHSPQQSAVRPQRPASRRWLPWRANRLAAALFLAFLHAALAVEEWNSCGQNDHFSANSTYQSNLGQLSATLPKNATTSGRFRAFFATGTVGTVPDIVYALTLCRSDIDNSTCEACVATAFQDAQQFCAYKKEVFIAYNECYLP